MKTPKDFDYDIWKDEDGHYCVRVKRTGETTKVSEAVVRELWRELYRMEKERKSTTITGNDGTRHIRLLSLDESPAIHPELCAVQNAPWLVSRETAYEDVELAVLEQDFLKTLTAKQRKIYQLVIKEGQNISACAESCGISSPTVLSHVELIRKKAKLFFCDT